MERHGNRPGLLERYITMYGFVLLYVFIAVMCMNAVIYLLNLEKFCYAYEFDTITGEIDVPYMHETTYSFEKPRVSEQNCVIIHNQEELSLVRGVGADAHNTIGFFAWCGWVLTSPRAKRLYRKKKIPFLQRL